MIRREHGYFRSSIVPFSNRHAIARSVGVGYKMILTDTAYRITVPLC